jgi:hypothetical protein
MISTNYLSASAKIGILKAGGYGSLRDDKMGRLGYNLLEATSLVKKFTNIS